MTVPIYISDGDAAFVTFKGVGFDRRVFGKSPPSPQKHACDKFDVKVENRHAFDDQVILMPPAFLYQLFEEHRPPFGCIACSRNGYCLQ